MVELKGADTEVTVKHAGCGLLLGAHDDSSASAGRLHLVPYG